jgi:Mce-associated membrane protein
VTRESRWGNLLIALVAALVASLAVIGWLVTQERGASDDLADARSRAQALSAQDDAEKAALEAAKEVLVQITTYSWKDGEHDFAWLDKIANAELKEKLAPNVGDLQKAIVDGQATAKGQVVDAAGRVVDDSQVEVLAFVDQAITDETSADVKIEEQRVSMTMKLVSGSWLVDRLELLSGTNSGEGAR